MLHVAVAAESILRSPVNANGEIGKAGRLRSQPKKRHRRLSSAQRGAPLTAAFAFGDDLGQVEDAATARR